MASQPSTTTTINKTELPKWVDGAAQENLGIADTLSKRPYTPYTGQLTAGASPLLNQAYSNASNNATAYQGVMGQANQLAAPTSQYDSAMTQALGQSALSPNYTNTMQGAQGIAAGSLNPSASLIDQWAQTAQQGTNYQPRSFLQGDVSAYMNPYIQNVEDRAIDNAGRAFQNNLNSISSNAVSAGAFGGSRQGLAEGVAASENARSMGDLSAQLRAQGFDTASQLLQGDLQREDLGEQMRQAAGAQLGAAGQSLSSIGLNTANSLGALADAQQAQSLNSAQSMAGIAQDRQNTNLQAAQQLAANAEASNTMSNQNSAVLATLGGQQREINQAQLQEQYAKWKEQQDYPLQQLNMRLAALGATPYGGTQTQQTTGQSSNNGALSIFGSVLGILPMLMGLSDEREKTDIKKIGKDKETGIDLYSFRYKGDPKTYPKVVGPMAQDIEKKFPGAVEDVAGRKAVNLGFGRQTGLMVR